MVEVVSTKPFIDSIEIYIPTFYCDIAGYCDAQMLLDQTKLQDMTLHFSLTLRAVGVNQLCTPTDHHQNICTPFFFTFTGPSEEAEQGEGQDQWHLWTTRNRLPNRSELGRHQPKQYAKYETEM